MSTNQQKFCLICGTKLRKHQLCGEHRKHYHLDEHLNIYRDSKWTGGIRFTLRQITEDGVYVYWGRHNAPYPGYFGDPPHQGEPESLWEISLGKRLAKIASEEGEAQ